MVLCSPGRRIHEGLWIFYDQLSVYNNSVVGIFTSTTIKDLEDKQPGLTSEVTGVKHFIISLSLPVVHQSNVISLAFFAEYFLLNVLLNN